MATHPELKRTRQCLARHRDCYRCYRRDKHAESPRLLVNFCKRANWMSRRSENPVEWIALLSSDAYEASSISKILTGAGYRLLTVSSFDDVLQNMDLNAVKAILLDIDSLPLDNRAIRGFALRAPAKPLLCISKERFHPELEEAFVKHVYACLAKPVDHDELLYWMKSIQRENNDQAAGRHVPPTAENDHSSWRKHEKNRTSER